MDFEEIVVDVREGIGILTLSRPEKLNALTSRMADEITYAIESLSSNEHVRVIVLTGKGKAFCAEGPPIALALAKENINKGINADLETILRLEAYAQGALTQTKDYLEGVRAFKEKRTPRFMGM